MKDPYDSLVPIFRAEKTPSRVQQHGTGVYFKLNGDVYLLTAAHVIDGSEPGQLLVPGPDGLVPVAGSMYASFVGDENRKNDNSDFALFRLEAGCKKALNHHFSPFPQTKTELLTTSLELGCCSISGYPVSKGTNKGGQLSSEIYSFRGVAAGAATYEKLGLDPSANIVLHYDRSRAVYPGTLQPFPGPALKGVSGGAIFSWPKEHAMSNDWSIPSLIGIFHTYYKDEGLAVGSLLMPYIATIGLMQMQEGQA
ncbi:serine protease [Xanthomonas campestris pv. campestris]|uniref:serine protease n=1 Tax=Xanthomonas campestris TaxID=339 RepID=UPI001D14ADC0|nr:serine protease [Xanthomonas campestris]MCC3256291.1 serine protease [Xanthomonas campestris pv. armoraciae]